MIQITLSTDSQSFICPHDAIGWDSLAITMKRSSRFYGLFFEYSTPLKFFGQAANFIKLVYENSGIHGTILISIAYDEIGNGSYTTVFEGSLNLSKLEFQNIVSDFPDSEFESSSLFVEIYIDPSNIATKINNRSKINIPLNATESIEGNTLSVINPVELVVNGLPILKTASWDQTVAFGEISNGGSKDYSMLSDLVVDEIGDFKGVSYTFSPPDFHGELTENRTLSVQVELNATIRTEATRGTITPFPNNTGYVELIIGYGSVYTDNNTTLWTGSIAELNVNPVVTDVVNSIFTNSIAPVAGEKVWIFWRVNETGYDPDDYITFDFDSGYFQVSITESTTYDASTASSYLIFEALNKVLESITDVNEVTESEFFGRIDSSPKSYTLDGCGSNFALTSGFELRNFTDAPPIALSLDMLFRSLNSIWNIGLGNIIDTDGNEVVLVGQKSEFFNAGVTVLERFFIPEINVVVASELYYQNAEIGYNQYFKSDINSLDEFNTEQTRSNTISVVDNDYLMKSDICASGYAVESTRRSQFYINPVDGTDYDKTTFGICTIRTLSGWESETDQRFMSISGILSPSTAMNLRISPARNFMRHMSWLSSSSYKNDNLTWRVQDYASKSNLYTEALSECNSYEIGGIEINERMSITSTFPKSFDRIFIPEFIEFEAPLTITEFLYLKQNRNRYGLISVSDLDTPKYFGYIWELEFNPYKQKAKFKLLRYA